MTKHTLALTAALAVLIASPAQAQDGALPRVEIGVVGSGLLVAPAEDGVLGLVAVGPSITIGIAPRVRVDVRAQIVGPNEGSGLYGLYEALVRFPLGQSQRALMTAGVAGSFSYYHFREYRIPRPDGSAVIYPGDRGLRASLPRIGSVGFAHERLVSQRLSMLLGADALIGGGAIVARGTLGLSFGVRRSR